MLTSETPRISTIPHR